MDGFINKPFRFPKTYCQTTVQYATETEGFSFKNP